MSSKLTLAVLLVIATMVVTSAFDFNDFPKRQSDIELEDALDVFGQHLAEKRGRYFVCKHPLGYTCWCDKKFRGKDKFYRVCDFASGAPINGE